MSLSVTKKPNLQVDACRFSSLKSQIPNFNPTKVGPNKSQAPISNDQNNFTEIFEFVQLEFVWDLELGI
jgi:hypothetical protein